MRNAFARWRRLRPPVLRASEGQRKTSRMARTDSPELRHCGPDSLCPLVVQVWYITQHWHSLQKIHPHTRAALVLSKENSGCGDSTTDHCNTLPENPLSSSRGDTHQTCAMEPGTFNPKRHCFQPSTSASELARGGGGDHFCPRNAPPPSFLAYGFAHPRSRFGDSACTLVALRVHSARTPVALWVHSGCTRSGSCFLEGTPSSPSPLPIWLGTGSCPTVIGKTRV